MKNTLRVFGVLVWLLLATGFPTHVLAAGTGVTITAATGGGAISANTNGATGSGTYTALTGPVLSENNPQGVSTTGTLILTVPAGFEFDPLAAVTAQVTPVSGKNCDATNGLLLGTSAGTLAQTVYPTSTTITINVFSVGLPPQQCVITFTNIKVRPTTGSPLTSGNITRSGTASLTENPATTNYGTLSTVVGAASKLVFVQEPGNAVAGAPISPAVSVAITDLAGNIVTGNSSTVTLAIGSNPGGGTLSGTVSVAAVAGVATFSNLSINKIGSGYTLVDSDGALSSATSSAFNIIPGAVSATVSTVTASPTSVQADGTSTSTITVTLKDGLDNPVSGKTVTLSAGAGSSIISAASGTSSAGGVVTFTVKDAVAETVTYTAKDTSDNITITQTATVTYTPVSMVLSINRANPDPTSAATVAWTVTFSRSVSGVNASVFSLAPSGVSGAYIASVSGSGTTWTVTANTGIGSGTLGLNQTGPGAVVPPLIGTFTGQLYTITATPALAEYRMDEASWNGTPNEVVDSSGSGNNAQAFNSANTATTSAALVGSPGTCGYGVFDNGATITKGYIQTPLPNLTSDFTVTAWIRTTNNTVSGQRILIDDQNNSNGYGFSLADGSTGILRFYSRGISPVILDSTYTVANNTWYFVAAVADIINKKRTIYVYNQSGSLLNTTTEAAWTGGTWGTDAGPVSIGGETNASAEPPASFHFHGNLDEVRVYQKVLSQSALAVIATQSHPCAVAGPDHYELSLPTASITCLPTIATVTACADSVSPCINKYTAVSGFTATLAASAGTLSATTVTFDAAGMASTALSYPAAVNGAAASVSLSSVPVTAFNANKCCPDGINCVVSNSCATTFNTAGFIFSGTAGGAVATIPAQVAGTSSGTYYLRAVKTSTTTQACESALSGASSVNFAYECNDPTTCYGADLMSVNGGTSTTITRNNNGSVSSYAPVAMTFDANGNAPFTFNYNDAGKVTLHANKAAGGTLLSALSGLSNAFVVKPFGFVLSGIKQTAAPQLANPAAASAADAKFVKAGENFSATVTAVTATGNVAPNYGQEIAAEGVTLTQTLIAPSGGAGGSLANPAAFGTFSNGVATGTTFNWSEVGIITLTPSVADGNYLGAGDTTGTVSGNIGRFYPDHFLVSLPALTNRSLLACSPVSSFTYAGEQMRATFTLTARNGLSTPTTTQNYTTASSFAKLDGSVIANFGLGAVDLADAIAPTTATALTANLGLVSSSGSWTSGVGIFTANLVLTRAATPDGPYESFQLGILPVDSDGVTLRTIDLNLDTTVPTNGNDCVNVGSSSVRFGRLKLANAYGSELLDLPIPAETQYWNSTAFVTSTADNCTTLNSANMSLSYPAGSTLNATNMGVSHISLGGSPVGIFSSGRGILKLTKPGGTLSGKGSVLLTEDLTGAALPYLQGAWTGATYTQNPSALATFGVFKGANEFIYQRENY